MKTPPLASNFRPAGLALVVACVLAVFASPHAGAQIIYNNGPPNQQNGNEMTQWIQAEDFNLNAATNLNSLHFWDIEASGGYAYQGEGHRGTSNKARGSLVPLSP